MSKKIDDKELVEITGGADRIIDIGQGDSVKDSPPEAGSFDEGGSGGGVGGTGIGAEGTSDDGNQSL
jgi:hypothetical protein